MEASINFLCSKRLQPFIALALMMLIVPLTGIKAQDKLIQGHIEDDSGSSLAWVNIGIRNKNIGMVSDEQGRFRLKIPAEFHNDSLTFSSVGFEESIIPIKKLPSNDNKLILRRKINELDEVVITNKKPRQKTLGTRGFTPLVWSNISFKGSYYEQAKLIPIKKPSKLLAASMKVSGSKNKKDSITFRLNIYKVQNDMPGNRLIEKNFVKTFPTAAKTVTFDLENAAVYLDEDCVIAFEYIPKLKKETEPWFSIHAKLGGNGGFVRNISLGKWKHIKEGCGSIFIEVMQ